MLKSFSCPAIFKYLEELDFDARFELSLFETKSESVVGSIVPNSDFAAALEIEKSNKAIENFILRQLQTEIEASNIVDFLEAASATLGSSVTAFNPKSPTEQPFIPTIPVQPIITYQKSAVNSSSSTPSTSKIASPPHTPRHTPHTSAAPTPPTSPRPIVNPPRVMVAHFSPLALPQVLDDMLANYQRKIPLFDGIPPSVSSQQHVDQMTDFFERYEIDAKNVTMRLFVQTFGDEVRKWFRALSAASITTLANLQRQFLDHWEVKKNPL